MDQLVCVPSDEGTMVAGYSLTKVPAHGVVTLDGGTGAFYWTSDVSYYGPDSFSYIATDDAGNASTEQIVQLESTDTAPSCDPVDPKTVTSGKPTVITIACSDPDGDPLTVASTRGPSHGRLQTNASDMSFVYQSDAGYSGTDFFYAYVSDGARTSTARGVNLTVNRAPSCEAASASTTSPTAVQIPLACTDPESGAVTIRKVLDPAHGTVSISGSTATYTPAAGYTGTDSFTFAATDPSGATSAPATASITVNAPARSDTPANPPARSDTPANPPAPSDTTANPSDPPPLAAAGSTPDPKSDASARLRALAERLAAAAAKKAHKARLSGRRITVGAVAATDCPAGCTVTMTITPLGSVTLNVRPGHTASLVLKPKRGLKALKRFKARITVTIRDAVGVRVSATRTLKI